MITLKLLIVTDFTHALQTLLTLTHSRVFFTILYSFIFILQSPNICIHLFVQLCSFFHKEFKFVAMICGRAKKDTNKQKKLVSCSIIPPYENITLQSTL